MNTDPGRFLRIQHFVGRSSVLSFEAIHRAKPYILRFAWRFARELLRIKGVLDKGATLESILLDRDDDRNPWIEDIALFSKVSGKTSRAKVLNLLRGEPQIGIAPPPAPVDDYKISSIYEVRKDPGLDRWLEIFEIISTKLNFHIPAENDKDQPIGLVALCDPELVRDAWPSKKVVIEYENSLVQRLIDEWVRKSSKAARDLIALNYGIVGQEHQDVIALVRNTMMEVTRADTEQSRAEQILQLEDLIARAREALDMRVEQRALAQLAIARGFTRTEPQDSVRDFIDAVGRVSQGSTSRKVLEATVVKELDAPPD